MEEQIFGHYYGFLCFRHFLHLSCFFTLQMTHTPTTRLEILHSNAGWKDLSNLMAVIALDEAGKAIEDASSFGEFCEMFTNPSFLGSVSEKGTPGRLAGIIITLLWSNADALLVLCFQGLLPGFSLFLLVLSKLLPISPDEGKQVEPPYSFTGYLLHFAFADTGSSEVYFACKDSFSVITWLGHIVTDKSYSMST
ncbi:hypothetical protein FRC12_000263 [Ceratobasidium sp. 428]|nr:hypothetical protein FRC12_000263 [Ceratobasidium sp. 428]